MSEKDLLNFQIDRKFKNHGRVVLEKLQLAHEYIKSLELVLIKMGINEERYSASDFQYLKDRKVVLDSLNNGIRELTEVINGFEIRLEK
jgi:hypothetical protein